MVIERIQAEMQELAADKKALAEERVKYATQIGEHSSKLKAFVFDRLQSEISELHSDPKSYGGKLTKLEEFVVEVHPKRFQEFNAR